MNAGAKLREQVYQEGQRAFNSREACPYEGWRAIVWHKGQLAAAEYRVKCLKEEERALHNIPIPWEELTMEEKVENLNQRLQELEDGSPNSA